MPNMIKVTALCRLSELSRIHSNHLCTCLVVVSFRGTHNIADWLDDLDAVQTAYPNVDNGYVHKGFYSAWKDDLKSSVMESVTV